jgi:hypothetical protein
MAPRPVEPPVRWDGLQIGRGRSIGEQKAIVSNGRKAGLTESPREGPESGRKPAFRCEREMPLSPRNARFHESPVDLAMGGSRLFCSDEADRAGSDDPRIV